MADLGGFLKSDGEINETINSIKMIFCSVSMRLSIALVLVFFAPVFDEIYAPTEDNFGGEIIVEGDWSEVVNQGYVPLRYLERDVILAWDYAKDEDVIRPILKVDLTKDFENIRILLEPNLPFEVVNKLSTLIGGHLEWRGVGLPSIIIAERSLLDVVEDMKGVMWIESILQSGSRNLNAAKLLQSADGLNATLWESGFTGDGVIIGTADSGIDSDHACFREMINSSGNESRKIVFTNISIDDGDKPGHTDYRHGTHVAGSLVCHHVEDIGGLIPENEMTAPSYMSKLVFQDIVNESGWSPPDIDLLFSELAKFGGVIHSNSWGDDTTAYTSRSYDVDVWSFENPYSLAFIAPGNNGKMLLEPANARNVVSVAAASSATQLWGSSSHGPTEEGERGIFMSAPGTQIKSAGADGILDSNNNGSRTLSGTSMSTPLAASTTAVIQELVEKGVINFPNETEGNTPSGPLLRSLLAISTKGVNDSVPNFHQGFGMPDLSTLVSNNSTSEHVWIWDSFRRDNWKEWLFARGNTVEDLSSNPSSSENMMGPFLQEGDKEEWKLKPNKLDDVVIALSYLGKPNPSPMDEINLIVKLDNTSFYGNDFLDNGYSVPYTTKPSKNGFNQTTQLIRIPKNMVQNIEEILISVEAEWVGEGNEINSIGVQGDRIGISLAALGVIREPVVWKDDDGDGVLNEDDLCLGIDASLYDQDNDGCLDDKDGDGIYDIDDMCVDTPSQALIDDFGCVIANRAPIFSWSIDNSSLVFNNSVSISWNAEDVEGDDVYVNLYVENPAFNVLIPQCSGEFKMKKEKKCFFKFEELENISSNIDTVWNFRIVVGDFNNSSWTMPLSSYLVSDSFSFDDFSSESNNASIGDINNSKKGAVVEDSWFYSILIILVVSMVIFQVLRYIRKKKFT